MSEAARKKALELKKIEGALYTQAARIPVEGLFADVEKAVGGWEDYKRVMAEDAIGKAKAYVTAEFAKAGEELQAFFEKNGPKNAGEYLEARGRDRSEDPIVAQAGILYAEAAGAAGRTLEQLASYIETLENLHLSKFEIQAAAAQTADDPLKSMSTFQRNVIDAIIKQNLVNYQLNSLVDYYTSIYPNYKRPDVKADIIDVFEHLASTGKWTTQNIPKENDCILKRA